MPTCPAGHHVSSREPLYCPECGEKMPLRRQVVCPNGHVLAGHHRFCPECGVQLRSTRPIWLAGAALALVLCFLVLTLVPPADMANKVVTGLQEAIDWVGELADKVNIPGL